MVIILGQISKHHKTSNFQRQQIMSAQIWVCLCRPVCMYCTHNWFYKVENHDPWVIIYHHISYTWTVFLMETEAFFKATVSPAKYCAWWEIHHFIELMEIRSSDCYALLYIRCITNMRLFLQDPMDLNVHTMCLPWCSHVLYVYIIPMYTAEMLTSLNWNIIKTWEIMERIRVKKVWKVLECWLWRYPLLYKTLEDDLLWKSGPEFHHKPM